MRVSAESPYFNMRFETLLRAFFSPPREQGQADPCQDRAARRKPGVTGPQRQGAGRQRTKRLRVQDFRILFTETADTITIHDIGPRGGTYD
jgi:hypothetical protein